MAARALCGGAVRRAPVFFLLAVFAAAHVPAGESDWMDLYRKGVAEREAGRCAAAAYYFLEALRANPGAAGAIQADAVTTVEVLPRLMLADCLCRMGDREMARKYLGAALASGEERSPAGGALLKGAEACLSTPARAPAKGDRKERILAQVQERCGLSGPTEATLYPWHYDYEASQAFLREGMTEAGIQYLYRALEKKPRPESKSRIYGMWFTDYFPYYFLAKAFYQQGSAECALQALEKSLKTEDLKDVPEVQRERERMREELEGLAAPPAR